MYPSHTNACVGDNGEPDILDYAKGFASAAKHLINISCEGNGLSFIQDYAVYPICFNMRHSIELYIKSYIPFLIELSDKKGVKLNQLNKLLNKHDINCIWNQLINAYKGIDRRLADKAKKYQVILNVLVILMQQVRHLDIPIIPKIVSILRNRRL